MSEFDITEDNDGIPVADFHFKDGIDVQIWKDNLYSLPMNKDSWARVVSKNIDNNYLRVISIEDLIISKVGRYIQYKNANNTREAEKNIIDIIAAISYNKKYRVLDYGYMAKRLKEGARREKPTQNSKIHCLDWFFIRESISYLEFAKRKKFDINYISSIISSIILYLNTQEVNKYLLQKLYEIKDINKFKDYFMFNDTVINKFLEIWKEIVKIDDGISLVGDVNEFIKKLPKCDERYKRKLVYSGKKVSCDTN